jgi:AcrR family transcriptional regulator
VAEAAGVSKVTLFKYFARKEDLMLDRAPEAIAYIRTALENQRTVEGSVEALRKLALELFDKRHPLSGASADNEPFMRTFAQSPALISRAREMSDEIESKLARCLAENLDSFAEPAVLAAMVLGGYRALVIEAAQSVIAGRDRDLVLSHHRDRLDQLFEAIGAAARVIVTPVSAK